MSRLFIFITLVACGIAPMPLHKLRLLVLTTRATRQPLFSDENANDVVRTFLDQMKSDSAALAATEGYIGIYLNSFAMSDACNLACGEVADAAKLGAKQALSAAKDALARELSSFLCIQEILVQKYKRADASAIYSKFDAVVATGRQLKSASEKVEVRKWLPAVKRCGETFMKLSKLLIQLSQLTARYCQTPIDSWLSRSMYGSSLQSQLRKMSRILVACSLGMSAVGAGLQGISMTDAVEKHRILDKLEVIGDMEFSFIEAYVTSCPEIYHRDLPAKLVKYDDARATWGIYRKQLLNVEDRESAYATLNRAQITKTLCSLEIAGLLA